MYTGCPISNFTSKYFEKVQKIPKNVLNKKIF